MASLGSRPLGYVVIALSLISVGIGAKVSIENNNEAEKSNETSACLSGYVTENARISKIRSLATVKRDTAIDTLLVDVATLVSTPQQKDPKKAAIQAQKNALRLQTTFQGFLRSSAEVRAERAKNPLPELPTTCAELAKEVTKK